MPSSANGDFATVGKQISPAELPGMAIPIRPKCPSIYAALDVGGMQNGLVILKQRWRVIPRRNTPTCPTCSCDWMLIYLDVTYEALLARRPTFGEREYLEQEKARLAHAREHADLVVDTSELAIGDVQEVVLGALASGKLRLP